MVLYVRIRVSVWYEYVLYQVVLTTHHHQQKQQQYRMQIYYSKRTFGSYFSFAYSILNNLLAPAGLVLTAVPKISMV